MALLIELSPICDRKDGVWSKMEKVLMRKWIHFCISTLRMPILINGSPSEFFQTSNDLKQGNSLSPFLFVIVMEVLSCIISRATQGEFIHGFKVGGKKGEGFQVSHPLFVDDTLLFHMTNLDELKYRR